MSYKKQVRPVHSGDTNEIRDLLHTLEIECFTIDVQMGIKHLGLNGYQVFVLEVDKLGIKGLVIASTQYSIYQSPSYVVDTLLMHPEFTDLECLASMIEPIEKFCIEKKLSRVQVNLQEKDQANFQAPLHQLGFLDIGWKSLFQKNIPLLDDEPELAEDLH